MRGPSLSATPHGRVLRGRPPAAVAAALVALALVTALAVVLVTSRGGPGPPRGGPPPPEFFAPTSVWNAPLPDDVALDPQSRRLSAALVDQVHSEVAAHNGPWINTTSFSIPIWRAAPDTPSTLVHLDTQYPPLQQAFMRVPIPAGARAAAGSDASMTVWQPATDTMWEFWQMHRAADGWHARWGGRMQHASRNPGYFAAPYGGTASSLPLVGGLILARELRQGEIDHALALAVPKTAKGVATWPAQRTDGWVSDGSGIPEGTRYRLPATLDLSRLHLPRPTLMLARAAQRYGIIVRDTAGVVVFYGEDPAPLGADPYPRLFEGLPPYVVAQRFPWEALQVVRPRPPGPAARPAATPSSPSRRAPPAPAR